MRKTALSICLAGVILAPIAASAQATVDVRVNLPLVLPRLVVVSPGIQVVPDVEYEVFHVDGWYWVRQDDGWYRSRSHRGGWRPVPVRGVPPGLVRIPPGQYKRWHPVRAPARHEGEGWRGGDHGDHREGGWFRGERHERDGRGHGDSHDGWRGGDDDHGRHGKKGKHGKD